MSALESVDLHIFLVKKSHMGLVMVPLDRVLLSCCRLSMLTIWLSLGLIIWTQCSLQILNECSDQKNLTFLWGTGAPV